MNALLICSGGLDSVTLAYRLAAEQSLGALLTFDYGQRHRKEIDAARRCAERLAIPHLVLDIGHIGQQLSGSAHEGDTLFVLVLAGAFTDQQNLRSFVSNAEHHMGSGICQCAVAAVHTFPFQCFPGICHAIASCRFVACMIP